MKKNFLSLSLLFSLCLMWSCEQNELSTTTEPQANNLADSTQLLAWVKSLTRFPHRHLGTDHWRAAVQSVKQELQKLGYTVREDRFPVYAWDCRQYGLKVQTGNGTASFDCYYEYWSGFTPEQGVNGDLLYIGNSLESNTEEVSGKIVLADMPFSLSAGEPNPFVRLNHLALPEKNGLSALDLYWRCQKRGAKGTVFILSNSLVDHPRYMWPCMDSIPWPMPSLFVGKTVGEHLKILAAQASQATLTLTGAAPLTDGINLWAELPGKSDSTILVLTHLDAPFEGAVEDGTGMASVLSQAKAWKAQNIARRPYRMIFVFTAGHFYHDDRGSQEFALRHPEILAKTKTLFVLEHLGAKAVKANAGQLLLADGLTPGLIYHSKGKVEPALKRMQREFPIFAKAELKATKLPLSAASGICKFYPELDYISVLTAPYYLVFSDDTLDKVDFAALRNANQSIFQLIRDFQTDP